MGQEVEKVAIESGHSIVAKFDLKNPFLNTSLHPETEVLISFTGKDAVCRNMKIAAELGVPVVEGTTGWHSHLDSIKEIAGLTMIYSSNFSIGMYHFTKLVQFSVELFGSMKEYDCYLHEWHHKGKADSPSGTANKLANIMIGAIPSKSTIAMPAASEKIGPQSLCVTSSRVGRFPGKHEVGFDSEYDTIILSHQAHNRTGFAFGAVRAAEWLIGKEGIYTMDDFMNASMKRN